MCDVGMDGPDVQQEERPVARKSYTCCACDETIRPGDTYVRTKVLFEGRWSTHIQCLRCDAMADAIFAAMRARGEHGTLSFELDCGEKWDDVFGDPPEHVAALAFWLPGDPLPQERST